MEGQKISESHFTGDKGMLRIKQVMNELRYVCRSNPQPDTSIDGEIQIIDRGERRVHKVREGIIKFQSKAGSSWIKGDNEEEFYTPVKEKHLRLWTSMSIPVLFIVYHPADDVLYYKHVQSYVKEATDVFKRPFRIVFSKETDALEPTERCRKELAEIAEVRPRGVRHDVREKLYSNLLPVVKLPRLWTAPTPHKREEVHEQVHDPPPFQIRGNMLFTVEDLTDSSSKLREVVDGAVEELHVPSWLGRTEDQGVFYYMLYKLLGDHCVACGLEYDSKQKRNYFPREDEESEEFKRKWFSIRTKKWSRQPRATAKYLEYGRDKFWRHLAARFKFKQFGNEWALQIEPGYYITKDGEEMYFEDRIGPLATKQKNRERNKAVLNHVLFFSDLLARGARDPRDDSLITIWLNNKPVLEIAREPLTSIVDFGIGSDAAPFPNETEQLNLFGGGVNIPEN